jgi:hypothetical protein
LPGRAERAESRNTGQWDFPVSGVAMVESESALSPDRPAAEQPPLARPDATSRDAEDDGVPLRRLLAVAALTPAQAALLALDLVDELEARPDNSGLVRIAESSVRVTSLGRLRVVGAALAPEPDVAAAADLVRRLAATARRAGGSRREESAILIDRLAGLPGDVDDLAARVRDAAAWLLDGEGDERILRVRQELAALVATTSGHERAARSTPTAQEAAAHPASATVRWGTAGLVPSGVRPFTRRAWHRRRASRLGRLVLPGLIVVVLGALGWLGGPRAWSELHRAWETFFPPTPTTQPAPARPVAPSPPAATTPRPIPAPGPAAAGPVTAVTVQRLQATCASGQVCPVRVYVRLNQQPVAQNVAWTFQVVDRCTGAAVTRPGVEVTARAGWSYVYGLTYLQLPRGPALAVVAVTSAPARAASPPLLVPPRGGSC